MADFPVYELGPASHPEEGETVSDFTRPLVTAEGWEDVALSELAADGSVLLVFFPMDGGGKSIYTWREISSRGWEDDDLTVVGLSISTPFDHVRFIEERDLDYALYSDPQNGVAETFDIAHDLHGMAGMAEPRPAMFLLDQNLTVAYAWVATEWPETPPYDEVEDALDDR